MTNSSDKVEELDDRRKTTIQFLEPPEYGQFWL